MRTNELGALLLIPLIIMGFYGSYKVMTDSTCSCRAESVYWPPGDVGSGGDAGEYLREHKR